MTGLCLLAHAHFVDEWSSVWLKEGGWASASLTLKPYSIVWCLLRIKIFLQYYLESENWVVTYVSINHWDILYKYIVYMVCDLYLIYSCFNCTVVLFFLFLIIVTLCSLLQLHCFQNLWSGYMPDLSTISVMMLVLLRLLWQSTINFIPLFRFIRF